MHRRRIQDQRNFRVVLAVLLCLFLARAAECCWGDTAPKYGDMTHDYDLLINDELVLNCTLNSHSISIPELPNTTFYANSSHLLFIKNGVRKSSLEVHELDGLTSQLRIPNATSEDAGLYYCKLAIPDLPDKKLVCSSKVSIGTTPKPVKNLRCISKYYENLTCSWDAAENGVQTTYTLYKYHRLFTHFLNPPLQECPPESSNNSYCQWRTDTDPPFDHGEKVFMFVLKGQNSLGSHNDTFNISHYEILLPNNPQSLKVISLEKQSISLRWKPPRKMDSTIGGPPLQYEMWVQEMEGETKSKRIINVGVNTFSYKVSDLIPYMTYNISLRCRSKFAPSTLWSPFISVLNQTLPDVPYYVPEIIPEAFELHHFDSHRSVTLYWKPVLKKFFNGEKFKYCIVYASNDSLNNTSLSSSNNSLTESRYVNATMLTTTFERLKRDVAYTFHLYSTNEIGSSETYETLVVDRQEDIPELPEEITATSHDPGHYQLEWKPPKKNWAFIVDYVVFWCSSLKPWISRCEGPIQWLNASLEERKVTLNLSDTTTNFQFAVVARSAHSYSGMEWATCIVPYKAALGKVPYLIVEPKNSTSLKVIWHLDCPAQKSVVKKFEIVYCKADGNKQCVGRKVQVDVMNKDAENYELQNLHPFSNYRVIIRAYNLAGVPSEDSDVKFQSTLQGAPSDSPRDVKARSKPNATLHITWSPPLQPNGVINEYRIEYQDKVITVPVDSQKELYETDITGLSYYADYWVKVKACVKHECSPSSSPVFARTDIGAPGKMEPPRVESINSTYVKVSWIPPSFPNGPIDSYRIHWKEIKTTNSSDIDDEPSHKVVRGEFSTIIRLSCSNNKDGVSKYFFVVRAVNEKDGNLLYGPFSTPTQAQACLITPGVAMVIGVAIGGTLVLAFLMLLIYKLIKWMSDKIHQLKSITVKLPKGLDGPEANPLSTYDNIKHGLVQQTLNSGLGKLTYIIDENDKNRHGSGSSQYSYSSTDELLYRHGKCTKFARKPSGESSGCSSMSSSNTRNHASSESSAESDFMTPPSPDMMLPENGSQGNRKSVLPIVPEGQDSLVSENSLDLTPTYVNAAKAPGKFSENMNEVILKIEQPYSKFGCSGYTTAIPTWWANSFALYSTNLSNSEPSMIDTKDNYQMGIPYSKIGLAKSSGNILGLKTIDLEIGYSKFGLIPNFKNSDLKTFQITKLPISLIEEHGNNVIQCEEANKRDVAGSHHNTVAQWNANSNGVIWPNRMPYTLQGKDTNSMNDESGYIRFGKSKGALSKVSGYVPFKELTNVNRGVPTPSYPAIVNDGRRDYVQEPTVSISMPNFNENDTLNQALFTDEPPASSERASSNEVGSSENVHLSLDKNETCTFSDKSISIPWSSSENVLIHKMSSIHQDSSVRKPCSNTVPEGNVSKVKNSVKNGTQDVSTVQPKIGVPTAIIKPSLTKGYVPFIALTNMPTDSKSLVPNVTDTGNSNVGTLHADVVDPLASTRDLCSDNGLIPNTDCINNNNNNVLGVTLSVNCSSPRHKVFPMVDNISKCKYSQAFLDNEAPTVKNHLSKSVKNKSSSDHFITFVPTLESEICEV